MSHAEVENHTPFAFQAMFATDEEGRPLLVPLVKATFALQPGGGLVMTEKQMPISPAGQFYGEPDVSSYKYEPEMAFFKPATDVVLIGTAWAVPCPATQVDVTLRAGPLFKKVRVTGDRYWIKSLGGPAMTSPEPFESLPLTYERAFGGRDTKGRFEPRNPIGRGFYSSQALLEDLSPLPNLEDPARMIASLHDRPAPVGFGFISPAWQPRAAFGGTYDDSWRADRMPLLPKDFSRRFFSAASPGLTAPSYFKGDEFISVENVSPDRPVSFRLPAIAQPEHRVQLTSGRNAIVNTHLDTVIINTDENLVILIWRGYLPLANGLHDVVSIQVQTEGVSAPLARR
jgi:hypothetical protein